ncbi:MAG: phosphate starvation-inducible protein PsiF [Burkholderiales bacterium]|nr:phosphate starvation-inducible protein PsiF [Burkholderiales bacterium]
MKKCALVLALLCPLMSAQALTAQQSKMATCNKEATGKKGDERKEFMKTCLSAKPAATEEKTVSDQQSKMKTCNADAKGMKGDERKKFMSTCLSKK